MKNKKPWFSLSWKRTNTHQKPLFFIFLNTRTKCTEILNNWWHFQNFKPIWNRTKTVAVVATLRYFLTQVVFDFSAKTKPVGCFFWRTLYNHSTQRQYNKKTKNSNNNAEYTVAGKFSEFNVRLKGPILRVVVTDISITLQVIHERNMIGNLGTPCYLALSKFRRNYTLHFCVD